MSKPTSTAFFPNVSNCSTSSGLLDEEALEDRMNKNITHLVDTIEKLGWYITKTIKVDNEEVLIDTRKIMVNRSEI
jgi:hypothetical protein